MKLREYLKEIGGLSKQDLDARATSLAEELMKLRFRNKSGQLEQSHRIRQLRRDLARIKTLRAARGNEQRKASA